jgi:hypothetical protein
VNAPDLALAGAKTSEPEARLSLRRSGGKLTSIRTWQWVVTPEKAGPLSVPTIRIATFNPASGRIVDATSAPIMLRAAGIPAPPAPASAPVPAPPKRQERPFPTPSILVPVLIAAALLLLAIGYRLGRVRESERMLQTKPSETPQRPEASVERVLDALEVKARKQGEPALSEVQRLRTELARVAFSPQLSSRDEALGHLEEASRRLARRWRVRV